jgi:uncharacterized damage-inducible protein DinB
MTDDPRYPIGNFQAPEKITPALRTEFIRQIEDAPVHLRAAVEGLSGAQFGTPYRDGGWTVRQVVHHLPDSHMNAFVRFKLALTEEEPLVKTYEEALWAELADGRDAEPEISLSLLEMLHRRWGLFLRSLDDAQFRRTLRHPAMGVVPLDHMLALYAWHGRHHVAQITALRERMGW